MRIIVAFILTAATVSSDHFFVDPPSAAGIVFGAIFGVYYFFLGAFFK